MIHYPSAITYQKDSKFTAISVSNISRMSILHENADYLFTLKDSSGFVFGKDDITHAKIGINILPALVLALRSCEVSNYKQAHRLRIREGFSGENIATTWYRSYVDQVAPIVCDKDHLEGGFTLWRSFLKLVTGQSEQYQLKMYNTKSNRVVDEDVSYEVDQDELWSQHPDKSKEHIVLILGKRGFELS